VKVPVLKQGKYLIASIQSALTDEELTAMRDTLLNQVVRFRSQGVVIDVTALDVLDSHACRMLRDTALTIRLRGADTVIVGIQPEVAVAIVQMGVAVQGVGTALDLEEGLAYLARNGQPSAGRS